MQNKYLHLININFNSKKFAIFKTTNNRKTFLEIDEFNNFKYPLLEDFIALNTIYNTQNNFISYVPSFLYNEKVRHKIAGAIVLLDVISFGIIGVNTISHYDIEVTKEGVVLSLKEEASTSTPKVYIEDLKDLDAILGYKTIPLKAIHEAIDQNPNLNDHFKSCAHKLITDTSNNYPTFDFRIFYENIKTLNIIEENKNTLQSKYGIISGCYDSISNSIHYSEPILDNTVEHELAHAMYHFYHTIAGTTYIRMVPNGHFLDEAFNSTLTDESTKDDTYHLEKALTDYLAGSVSFNMLDYNQKGVSYLIEQLKSKYPEVDINYIIEVGDTIKETLISEGTLTPLDNSPYLLDELFKICLANINSDPSLIYDSFNSYSELFNYVFDDNLIYNYLEKYNAALTNLGITPTITKSKIKAKIAPFTSINTIITSLDNIYPCIENIHLDNSGKNVIEYNLLDYEGNYITTKTSLKNGNKAHHTEFNKSLEKALLKYYNIFGTKEFWQIYLNDYLKISPSNYTVIPLYLNNELITNAYLPSINITITLDNKNNLGYILSNETTEIINTNPSYIKKTSPVKLSLYLKENIWDKLDLSLILNEDYLKSRIGKHSYFFPELTIKDDKVVFLPLYKVSLNNTLINMRDIKINCNLENKYYITSSNNIEIPLEYNEKISQIPSDDLYLEELLTYYNILDTNKTEYSFTESELLNLYLTYIDTLTEQRAR